MATLHAAHARRPRSRRAADPRRGRGADRRRAGAEPRHDRRQRLLERPDEPPAAAARRARRDDDDRWARAASATVAGGGLLPRRLHDRRRRGRAADADHACRAAGTGDGFASVTLGRDGTCIVNAAATLDGGSPRIAIGCVDAVPRASRRAAPRPTTRAPCASAVRERRRSTRRPTSTPRPTTAATWPRSSPRARSRQASEGADGRRRRASTITVEVNGDDATSARSRRARLLVHFLRDDLDLTGTTSAATPATAARARCIVDGTLVKSCMLLAVQADGAHDRDGRGPRAGRRADRAPAGVLATTTRSSAATARPGC